MLSKTPENEIPRKMRVYQGRSLKYEIDRLYRGGGERVRPPNKLIESAEK